jgi:hypothetical protein
MMSILLDLYLSSRPSSLRSSGVVGSSFHVLILRANPEFDPAENKKFRATAKSIQTASHDNDATRVRKRAIEPPRLPRPAHEQQNINSFSHAVLLVAAPRENDCLVAARKPANPRQGPEIQLETAQSNEMLRTDPVAAEPLQQRHNVFTHGLLLGEGSTGNVVQATPDKPANAPPNMQHTPRDEVFQSDNVLNEVEMELIWLGEESMYCLVCPDFEYDYVYGYASPTLKAELRKLSRDVQSEAEILKHIVRM